MFRTILVAALATSGVAMGQVVEWTKRVDDGSTNHKAEVAMAVNRAGDDIIISWMHYRTTGPTAQVEVQYNVSTDGEQFRADVGMVPIPDGAADTGSDPMAAFGADGVGWVGYVESGVSIPTIRFWVASKDIGEKYANVAKEALFGTIGPPRYRVDKGVMAAGPPEGGGTDYVGLVFTRRWLDSPGSGVHRLHGGDSDDQGATWVGPFPVGEDPEGNKGGPNAMRILHNAPDMVGRRVVAYYQGTTTSSTPPYRARATWSDNGTLWRNSVDPENATVPCPDHPVPCTQPHTTEPITWIRETDLSAVYVLNTPTLAADPRDERTMYMAFVGRVAQTGRHDIFIAQSTDGGDSFSHPRNDPNPLEGKQVLRLLHVEDLGDPPDSHRFYPMVAVDEGGAVHVFYYVTWFASNHWKYQFKHACISSFRTHPHPHVVSQGISPVFDLETAPVVQTKSQRPFFGDYINAAGARGCGVFAGYITWQALQGNQNVAGVYVTKVNICIDADMNQDFVIDSSDSDLFVSCFAAGDPRADLNRDGQLTIDDVNRFWQSFNCACNP